MLPFHDNVRKTIGLACEINNTKACNCCYKGTVFLHLILTEKIEIELAQ